MPKDFPSEPATVDERLDAAYRFLLNLDKRPPTAADVARLTGLPEAVVSAWLAARACEE